MVSEHKGIDDALMAGATVETLTGDTALAFVLEADRRHNLRVAVPPDALDAWVALYIARPEAAYLSDLGFVESLALCGMHHPAQREAIRARFKAANFTVTAFDNAVKGVARNLRDQANADARQKRYEARADSIPPGGTDRVVIEVNDDERRVADEALVALQSEPGLFHMNGVLVAIACDTGKKPQRFQPTRAAGTPRTFPVVLAKLRELIATHTMFVEDKFDAGLPMRVAAHVPRWCVEAIHARGHYPELRELVGIIEAPTLRPDGSVISERGYDEATGLLLIPSANFPPVPEAPTRDDALAALEKLLKLLSDFPFKSKSHKAVWVATLFTLLVRHMIDGPVPAAIFDANNRGVGKSLLTDLLGIIVAGRDLPRYSYAYDQTEMSKLLLSIAVALDPAILFDNADEGSAVGGRALDQAITAGSIRGRILGQTRMVEMPWRAVTLITGNNLQIKGDTQRRAMLCRLEAVMENPEERTGFKIGDLLAYTRQNRPELLVAGLTILKAYILAGKPKPAALKPFGGFGAWSDLVRGAVHWLMGVDPLDTRKDLSVVDQGFATKCAVIRAWEGFTVGEFNGRTGLTAAEVLAALRADSREFEYAEMRAALAEIAHSGALPSARSLGKYLAGIRDTPIGNKRLVVASEVKGINRWKVEDIPTSERREPDNAPETDPPNPPNPPTPDPAGGFAGLEG